ARKKEMGVINASVTGMGLLTAQGPQPWHPASDKIKAAARQAAEYCDKHRLSLAQIAIQYALQYDEADNTLLGTRTVEELMNSLELLEKPLDEVHLTAILDILKPVANLSWPSGIDQV
ncbi:MAG: aldo/keto reductase, partial [Chloroflexota bacterium]